METKHHVQFMDSRKMRGISDESIDLIITSPPYPMIEMWDALFSELNPEIKQQLEQKKPKKAFDLMHDELDAVWRESFRVLKNGGMLCINIGDATRTIGESFQLFPNHARILQSLQQTGFEILPLIIWRKPTNSPNKFLGSGMLPTNAYITLEHEYILIARKNGKRVFSKNELEKRRRSGFFWEERNKWFSDTWDGIVGAQQALLKQQVRNRSAAFPLQLAYQLINMFSIYGDKILDPFLGTGTTMLAAAITGRNSIGLELEKGFATIIQERILKAPELSVRMIQQRILAHKKFLQTHQNSENKEFKYFNKFLQCEVKTKQEEHIEFYELTSINETKPHLFIGEYQAFHL